MWVLYTFAPKKFLGELLSVSPMNHIYIETFCSDFSYIEIWFADQNSKQLVIEIRINLTFAINDSSA